jgi:hypothetical protein
MSINAFPPHTEHSFDLNRSYLFSAQNDTTVEFMDENARMSFYDNEEMEVCSDHFESQMHDENSDSGLGSMSRGKISTLTTMFGLMNSPSTNKCEFDAILVSVNKI